MKKVSVFLISFVLILSVFALPLTASAAVVRGGGTSGSYTSKITTFNVKSFSVFSKNFTAALEAESSKNTSSSYGYGIEFQYKINNGSWQTASSGFDGHQKHSFGFSYGLSRSINTISFRARPFAKVNGVKVYGTASAGKTYRFTWYRAKWYHLCMSVKVTGSNVNLGSAMTNYIK